MAESVYNSFPSQVVSDLEKSSFYYGLKIAKAIESEWFAKSTNNKFTLRYLASNRQVTESQEYIIIQLEFNALHSI